VSEGGALPKTGEEDLPSKRQQLLQGARSGFRLLREVVPPLVGAGLRGALLGGVLFGVGGLALAVALPWGLPLLGAGPTPLWLNLLNGVLIPLVLAIAGGYALMLQGVSGRLAEEVQKRGLVGYLYAILKPVTRQVAQRLKGTGTLSRAELTRVIKQSLDERMREMAEEEGESPSHAKRLEGFLMEQSRRVLLMVALRTALSAPDVPTAVRDLETLGLERVESILAEVVEDLFFFQMMLALAAGLLVSALPTVLLLLLR
jgi:hypothetical protein